MITLQFVRQADLASDAIAWFTQGDLSHVDAVMPDGSLLGARSDAIGGQLPGVRIRPPNYVRWAKGVRMTLLATVDQEDAFYAFLKAQVGKPYDDMAIVAFVAGTSWTTLGAWFCSALQGAALLWAKRCPPLYVPPTKLTPDALAVVMTALGARAVVMA